MKTFQEKLRNSIKWRILRKIRIFGNRCYSWAGRKMIDLSREADEKDYPSKYE